MLCDGESEPTMRLDGGKKTGAEFEEVGSISIAQRRGDVVAPANQGCARHGADGTWQAA